MSTFRNYCKSRSRWPFIYRRILIRHRRHLRRHNFYACPKCYTKFQDSEEQDLHAQENPCRKSCRNKRCTRHLPSNHVRESACECILSPEQQWRQLFLLQYPGLPVPDLALFSSTNAAQEGTVSNENMTLDGLWDELAAEFGLPSSNVHRTNDATSDDTVYNSIERMDIPGNDNLPNDTLTRPVNETTDPQQATSQLSATTHNPPGESQTAPAQSSTTIQIDQTFFTEVQTLRQRVQLLEQRLSQPTDREQDLEMVLGNVWQALVRTGSADAQPESPVWRLVRRFAGSILSTVPRSSAETQPAAGPTAPSSFQWQELLGPCLPSGAAGSRAVADSGYGSLP